MKKERLSLAEIGILQTLEDIDHCDKKNMDLESSYIKSLRTYGITSYSSSMKSECKLKFNYDFNSKNDSKQMFGSPAYIRQRLLVKIENLNKKLNMDNNNFLNMPLELETEKKVSAFLNEEKEIKFEKEWLEYKKVTGKKYPRYLIDGCNDEIGNTVLDAWVYCEQDIGKMSILEMEYKYLEFLTSHQLKSKMTKKNYCDLEELEMGLKSVEKRNKLFQNPFELYKKMDAAINRIDSYFSLYCTNSYNLDDIIDNIRYKARNARDDLSKHVFKSTEESERFLSSWGKYFDATGRLYPQYLYGASIAFNSDLTQVWINYYENILNHSMFQTDEGYLNIMQSLHQDINCISDDYEEQKVKRKKY